MSPSQTDSRPNDRLSTLPAHGASARGYSSTNDASHLRELYQLGEQGRPIERQVAVRSVRSQPPEQEDMSSPRPQQDERLTVFDPYSFSVYLPQSYGGEKIELADSNKGSATTPWRSQPAKEKVNASVESKPSPVSFDRKMDSSTSDGHLERRGLRDQFADSLFNRSEPLGRSSRQEIPPSQDSPASVRLSGVIAEDNPEMLRRASLGRDTISSTGSDEVLQWPVTAERISSNSTPMQPPSTTKASPFFSEAREDLKRLQADIEDLSESSDDCREAGSEHLEMTRLSLSEENYSRNTTNNVFEETNASGGPPDGLRPNTEGTADSSGSPSPHKRSQLGDSNEDRAGAEVVTSRKRTRLSNLRFVCCFHNGPGRKCSGTDDTISEVLKKLSEQHDTHVCDRCWVLKVKDESSGLFVHPNAFQTCRDHCLSPQCHRTPASIGHRHEFNPQTCGTKTSRVRPGDSEAVYRFIFRLVHPELDCPASVLTAEHSLHLDAVPRQSRRKLNREELTARANDLEKRLEAGEQQNALNAERIAQLERDLANAHLATTRAEEQNAALEKQSRRIVAMLSDALRTGVFLDALDHQSLLRRVEEDAPGALVHQSQSLLTPSASDRSRNSLATSVGIDLARQDRPPQPPACNALICVGPQGTTPKEPTMDEHIPNPGADEYTIDAEWLGGVGVLDEPRTGVMTITQILRDVYRRRLVIHTGSLRVSKLDKSARKWQDEPQTAWRGQDSGIVTIRPNAGEAVAP